MIKTTREVAARIGVNSPPMTVIVDKDHGPMIALSSLLSTLAHESADMRDSGQFIATRALEQLAADLAVAVYAALSELPEYQEENPNEE